MYRAKIEIDGPFSAAAFAAMVEGFVVTNMDFRRENPGAPLLYAMAGAVKYAWEPWIVGKDGKVVRPPDVWLDWPAVIRAKAGNCKDFVAERVAELRLEGVAARVIVLEKTLPDHRTLFHVVVGWPDGRPDEDPSLAMGMPPNQLDVVDARFRSELGGRVAIPTVSTGGRAAHAARGQMNPSASVGAGGYGYGVRSPYPSYLYLPPAPLPFARGGRR